MSVKLKVPAVGESITEVEIGEWLKKEGDHVEKDENIVIIETDKATVEVPAPEAGRLSKILKKQGEGAAVGDVIGELEAGQAGEEKKPSADDDQQKAAKGGNGGNTTAAASQPVEGERLASRDRGLKSDQVAWTPNPSPAPRRGEGTAPRVMPAAQRVLDEKGISADQVQGTGPGGRVLKEDALRADKGAVASPTVGAPARITSHESRITDHESRITSHESRITDSAPPGSAPAAAHGDREEEIVPMSLLRRKIAERLVQAQQNAALLTTFNEIDMSAVMTLRKQYQDRFQERYEIKLGFMSFFVKATIEALKEIPQINAELRGKNVVYRNYYDIGIAIGGGKGLVVPILRSAERFSFAQIEQAIAAFAQRAKENRLKPEELQGGTFTITNGGIYGSMLSTPIVNPPQSGVLGMHAIQDRPMAVDGQVVIRPMMYVALTYDHRIVDGREAVTFLKRIKEVIEKPSRMLLEV